MIPVNAQVLLDPGTDKQPLNVDHPRRAQAGRVVKASDFGVALVDAEACVLWDLDAKAEATAEGALRILAGGA